MSTEKLPPCLSPIATNHPASSAYYITLSPHEWTWKQEEQEAIARAVVALDRMRNEARESLEALYRHVRRSCHSERLAANALISLGFELPARNRAGEEGR